MCTGDHELHVMIIHWFCNNGLNNFKVKKSIIKKLKIKESIFILFLLQMKSLRIFLNRFTKKSSKSFQGGVIEN